MDCTESGSFERKVGEERDNEGALWSTLFGALFSSNKMEESVPEGRENCSHAAGALGDDAGALRKEETAIRCLLRS